MNQNNGQLLLSGPNTAQSGHMKVDGFDRDSIIDEERSYIQSKMTQRSKTIKEKVKNKAKVRVSNNAVQAIATSNSMMSMSKTSTAHA